MDGCAYNRLIDRDMVEGNTGFASRIIFETYFMPLVANSIIRTRVSCGRGFPLMNSPPSWFTRP